MMTMMIMMMIMMMMMTMTMTMTMMMTMTIWTISVLIHRTIEDPHLGATVAAAPPA